MKNRLFCSDVPSSCLRRVAWVTIAIQAALPLAVAFTPAIAGVDSGQHVFPSPPTPPLLHTQTYRLADGETVDSVAQKYHLTPAALRQLNQLRTFAHGFDHLQPGDELDVPIAPLPQVQWHDEPAVAPAADDPAQRVAGVASQAGSFLANHPNGEAAAAMARGMATGAASGQLQQWLSRFGTARVQLGADKHFSLKNSQFDLLAPLYDQGDNLLFSQGSLHRTDERTQLNLGAGLRHFAPRYMLGANFFTDYDLSRDHARIGLGVEYWHDFLKLSANGYQRLTGWRDAPELTDYEARPANGWDIRAQAWLPALPQLGGRLSYEQYYGDEVALFGKDQRQRSPYAFTAGIEYTPVPLLAFSVAQRQGKSGENDTRLGVEMHYQLGMPWQQQINPTAVAAMRSLAGSHYALVERNNNIILAYRKKELLRLHTASQVTGYGGEKKSLEVSVTSSHALARIDWSAPALLAAGGKIVQDSAQDYSLVLPAYQFKPGVNHYTVSGVAVDSQGNTSDPSETRVTVQAPLIDANSSTLTPRHSTLTADGKSSQLLTLVLKDMQGQPLEMPLADIHMAVSALKSAHVSAVTQKQAGVYQVTVTAGSEAENITLTPVLGNLTLGAAQVVISYSPPDGAHSKFVADRESITADGQDSATLTFTAQDANGNPLAGLSHVTFMLPDGTPTDSVKLSTVTDKGHGVYQATLRGTRAGSYKVTPQVNGKVVGNLNATVTLKAGQTPDGAHSKFVADRESITADGQDSATLTFTAQDANGNPLAGLSHVTFMLPDGTPTDKVNLSTVTDKGHGVYQATLRGTRAGSYKVTPQVNGKAVGNLNATVTLKAGQTPDGAHSKFVADRESITADGQDSATLTFTAQDANGNPLAGLSHVTFMLPDGTPTDKVNLSAVTDKGHGVYQATLRGTRAGSYKVTPQVNGKAVGNLNATVTLKAFVTAVQDIQVNGYEFAPTAGFPKTGFTRAYFTVRLNGGAAQDYNWSTSAPDWTAVSADGVVRFTDKGNANEVTITATAKNNPARVSRYAFKLSDWYIYNSTGMSWPDANSYCAKQSASLPTRLQLGGTATEGQNQRRGTIGSLWSEWGDQSTYLGITMAPTDTTWSSELYQDNKHYVIAMSHWRGWISAVSDEDNKVLVACRIEL